MPTQNPEQTLEQIKTMTGDLGSMAGDVEASNSYMARLLYNRLKAIAELVRKENP
jgi:hypothetical protein